MATRNTTTKAKTKTTKKPAVKARAASAKSTKTTSAKITKPQTTKVKNSKVLTVAAIRKLHLLKAFVTAALAITAGFLMTNASYALTIGYEAKDELISLTDGKTAFVHGSQTILDVQIKWLLIIILGLSAIFSLLAATKMRRQYQASIDAKVSAPRWIGLGITSALIAEVVALLAGISDIFVLKIVAGLVLATCALGWTVEKRLKQAGRPVWSEFLVSLFMGALVWVLIGSYAISTWVYGLIRYPWFVYALIATVLVGFLLLAANQYKHISGWKNYLVIDRNYVLIATILHVAFATILILGYQK